MKPIPLRFVRSTLLAAALFVAPCRGAEATPSADWSEAMAAFAREDAARPSPPGAVLFVGSSSIRLWSTLAADFPGMPVINRGFGGSHIADSVYHFERLVSPHRPRLVVFYAGTNDLAAGKTPEAVAGDFRAFCDQLHAARPEARIIFISIQLSPARWQHRDKFALANTYIAAFCAADPRRRLLDTNAAMLTPDGQARPEFFHADQLHLSPAGYAMWCRLLAPLLQYNTLRPHGSLDWLPPPSEP
jgi:lysophospholipase L1-like esterase